MYSALPYKSGAFCSSLVDQPTYFKSQVLVQGCKKGSKEWIWKNKSYWKLFVIYKIDFAYCRFSKIFNSAWNNPKKFGEYSLRCEGNDNKWKFLDQMKYWITVVSKTETKLEIWCLNPFWDSQMPHSTVSKKPSGKFFEFFSFIFILFTCPAVASNFFRFFQALLKIFENLQ
jgi:hypothetical protein